MAISQETKLKMYLGDYYGEKIYISLLKENKGRTGYVEVEGKGYYSVPMFLDDEHFEVKKGRLLNIKPITFRVAESCWGEVVAISVIILKYSKILEISKIDCPRTIIKDAQVQFLKGSINIQL